MRKTENIGVETQLVTAQGMHKLEIENLQKENLSFKQKNEAYLSQMNTAKREHEAKVNSMMHDLDEFQKSWKYVEENNFELEKINNSSKAELFKTKNALSSAEAKNTILNEEMICIEESLIKERHQWLEYVEKLTQQITLLRASEFQPSNRDCTYRPSLNEGYTGKQSMLEWGNLDDEILDNNPFTGFKADHSDNSDNDTPTQKRKTSSDEKPNRTSNLETMCEMPSAWEIKVPNNTGQSIRNIMEKYMVQKNPQMGTLSNRNLVKGLSYKPETKHQSLLDLVIPKRKLSYVTNKANVVLENKETQTDG